jgi:type I restriction enzyme S subunit
MNLVVALLGEITEILSGTTPESAVSNYWNGESVWVTPTDLGNNDEVYLSNSERKLTKSGVKSCNLKKVPKGAIVMSSRAPIGHLAIAGCELYTNQGCKSFIPLGDNLDSEFLFYLLRYRMPDIQALGSGATFLEVSKSSLEKFKITFPQNLADQKEIAAKLKSQLAEVETARVALQGQLNEIVNLANAYIRESIESSEVVELNLGDVLEEVKKGIGENWADYPVLGATRNGLAPAKEPPGKQPQRYKPVFAGTVFYNPMRILIGSIAFVDNDDQPGITSPDYVALQGKPGMVDSRWFYYWLRSPYGEQCINSLARGAVRERMLFNRLAEGMILLPSYQEQCRVSKALAHLKSVKSAIQKQLDDLNKIPERLLANAFADFKAEP